jgi:uncharacterized repeat protein (TIGR03803 family)
MKYISILLITLATVVSAMTPVADAQTLTTLLTFTGSNGQNSEGNLVWDSAGNLYGTTGSAGGAQVFRLRPTAHGPWTQNVLWRAASGGDPDNIRAGVIFDASGNLYGTSIYGGQYGCGTVFEVIHNSDETWTEKNLHDFDCTDGYQATGGVIFDKAGNLYGTTSFGGTYNWGTVYKLSPNTDGTWTETVLHNFNFGSDGGYPGHLSLVFDSKGALYGTAGQGANGSCVVWTTGCGTIYKLTPNTDGTWTFTVIYSFTGGDDGGVPQYDLKFDKAGNLYSTTYMGGKYNHGVAFELVGNSDGTWSEKVLYSFRSGSDGDNPFGGVIFDGAGNLYGTTLEGGGTACGGYNGVPPGCGVVYELMPSSGGTWTEKVLVRFDGKPNDTPINDLVMDGIGNLYGTAAGYDTDSLGSIYEVIRTGSVVTFIGDSGIVGATAKIVGQGFEGATAVSFNGTAASFTVKSDTYMTATIPAGATTGQVTVTEPGGTLTSNENFNVLPTTRDFVPNNGPAGTVVTIYGMSLTQTTAVSFDGVAATGFSVVSDTELQATVPEGANTGFIKITTAGGSFTTCNKFYVTP